MKRLCKTIFALALFLGLIYANKFASYAANITTVNVSGENNKITVSGSCDAGVLACAVLVYDSTGTTLIDMETCAVDAGSYQYTLANTFAEGTYEVRVADYNGGSYVSKSAAVTGTAAATPPTTNTPSTVAPASSTTATTASTAPKTSDNSIFGVLFAIVGVVALGTAIRVKRAYK